MWVTDAPSNPECSAERAVPQGNFHFPAEPPASGHFGSLRHVQAMEDIARGVEWIGVAIIVAALVLSGVRAVADLRKGVVGADVYSRVRAYFGRGILLGLETLVAADLIRTVAVQPTLENVAVLALIVLVRTLLSFSLDVEIEGVLPWRKRGVRKQGRPVEPS